MGRPRDIAAPDRIVVVAVRCFAARGFAGTSLRAIGRELDLANASILHHFASKRRLYAEVLDRIAASLEQLTVDAGDDPLRALHDAVFDWHARHPDYASIVIRELVDRTERPGKPRRWILEVPIRRAAERLAQADLAVDSMATLFHVIGSISYFHAGRSTMAGLLQEDEDALAARYREASWTLVSRGARA